MTETRLKYAIGASMIGAHLIIFIEIVAFYFLNGFDFDNFATILGIVLPMFSGYTTSISAFFIAERHALVDTSTAVTKSYVVLSFLFPALFVVLIFSSILLQALDVVFANFNQFRTFLTLMESAFAAYIGMFIYSLFKQVRLNTRNGVSSRTGKRRSRTSGSGF
jgi:hypothetical protein